MKLIIGAVICMIGLIACSTEGVLSVEGGKIRGQHLESGIWVYKGIPYAAAPVGGLRWKKPAPVIPWEGVRDCTEFGAAAMQSDREPGTFYWKEFYQDGDSARSEDCLFLNIWTPALDRNAGLPVMLWIHGGAFTGGFGHEIEFDGQKIAEHGAILVTINYRLGMAGFLSHPELTAENGGKGSGNYGLFDQLEALKWVAENIREFGGDPENVTVFGQSAGAGSVQALISSPLTKGLIHRAVIQSGGGLGGLIATKEGKSAEEEGEKMWNAAGITSLERMREYPARDFDKVIASYMTQNRTYGLPFCPCVDGEFLTETVYDAAVSGHVPDIPCMIGFCSDDIMPELMEKAAVDWSLLRERQGKGAAYVYVFSRDLPGDDMEQPAGGFGDMKGAFHSAELWYVFGTLDRCWRPMEEADYELSDRMTGYWTNFARYGNPNGPGLPEWEPCTEKNPHIQELNINQQ